jgi:hypothetical protein
VALASGTAIRPRTARCTNRRGALTEHAEQRSLTKTVVWLNAHVPTVATDQRGAVSPIDLIARTTVGDGRNKGGLHRREASARCARHRPAHVRSAGAAHRVGCDRRVGEPGDLLSRRHVNQAE